MIMRLSELGAQATYTVALTIAIGFFQSEHVLADDLKNAPSSICQGFSKEGRDLLRYNSTSLEALEKDVTVICPIVRDRVADQMNHVSVRFRRKSGDVPREVKGELLSCNSVQGGCKSASGGTHKRNEFTSDFIDARELPSGENSYFTYKVVLPEGWKIVNIEWNEN